MKDKTLKHWSQIPLNRKFYVVDGNIGAGKSYLLSYLARAGLVTFEEPREDWAEYLS
jgi:predicted ATPase